MEENVTNSSWFQDALKKGVVLGVIHCIIFLIIYMVMPSKLTGFSYLFLIMILNIGYSVYYGNQWRTQLGGFMEFGYAFKHAFMLLLFNGIVGLVFNLIFVTIEPSYPELMSQGQLDTSVYWAGMLGAPEATLSEMREKFDFDDMAKNYSYLGMLKGFGVLLICYALGASLIALFTRKIKPETL